jgi:hypothetical protein
MQHKFTGSRSYLPAAFDNELRYEPFRGARILGAAVAAGAQIAHQQRK